MLVPFVLCALAGMLAAITGVDGGFIMVTRTAHLLRMPMHVAVGTYLFQILFTRAGLTVMQALTNRTVDLVLALLVAVGSTVRAQIGARLAWLLHGDQQKIILATVVLLVTVRMAVGLVTAPSNLLSYAVGK